LAEKYTISTQILLPVIEQLRERGFRARPLLEKLSIDPKLLDDVNETVSLNQYIALFEAAAEITSQPHFGLEAGKKITADSLGVLGFLFDSAPTLEDALIGLSKFLGALQEGTHMILKKEEDVVRYEYQILDSQINPRRQDTEYSIAATLTLIRRYVGTEFKPIEISFEHDRVGSHSFYEHQFGCHVFFQQGTNYILFDKKTLELGSPNISNKLYSIIASHLSEILAKKSTLTSTSDKVQSLLTAQMLENGATVTKLANKLGISESTLARRLKKEDTNFNEILTAKRMDLAQHLLVNSDSSISQIAMRIGYSENASFTRAFKNFTQQTPDQYRREYKRPK